MADGPKTYSKRDGEGGREAKKVHSDNPARDPSHDLIQALKDIQRGEDAMRPYEPVWHQCLAFFDNDQWVEVFANNMVERLETREGGNKPRHRPRLTRNVYTPRMIGECAALGSRVPEFECMPPNGDFDAVANARLSEKVLGGMKMDLRLPTVLQDTLIYAGNIGAGFDWNYWDPTHGEAVGTSPEGYRLNKGNAATRVLGQGDVMWEPGLPFEQSGWLAVRLAQTPEEVTSRKGYIGPEQLKADAQEGPHAMRRDQQSSDLVFVYHLLRKPSAKHPRGQWLQIAQNTLIAAPEDYPCIDERSGEAIQVVHELPWYRRPHRHRALGLGELALDVQRSRNRTINQIIAWRNVILNPKLLAPEGSIINEPDDSPGQTVTYRVIGGLKPEWQQVQEVPNSLFQELDQIDRDFDELFSSRSLPAGVESGQAIAAINERDMTRRGLVVRNVASWWAAMGEHLLYLAREHMDEDRLLAIDGIFGTDAVHFKGTSMKPVAKVIIREASVEPRTRAGQQAQIMSYADRGWIDAHQAMAALNAGTAESIINAYELDIAKQWREIQEFGRAKLLPIPPHVSEDDSDPNQAMLALGAYLQEHVPEVGEMDDHKVHIDILSQWMKTRDYEDQDNMTKQLAKHHLTQHQAALMSGQLIERQLMAADAGNRGMQNATRPAAPPGEASDPSVASQKEGLQ